jgi:putative aldouronate transport system substrate-binding protein
VAGGHHGTICLTFDNVKSLKDLEPILQTVKDNEPGLYPLTAQTAPKMRGMDWAVDNCGDTNNFGVLENAGQTTTFTNYYESQHYVEWVNTMYDWNQKGLLMPDILSSTDSNDIIMKAGKSFGYVSNLKLALNTQTGTEGMEVRTLILPRQHRLHCDHLCWVCATAPNTLLKP